MNRENLVARTKPLVAVIRSDTCPRCARLHEEAGPEALAQARLRGVDVQLLDVTDEARRLEARRAAQRLGITAFFDRHQSETSTVGIWDGAGQLVWSGCGVFEAQPYLDALDRAASFGLGGAAGCCY